MQQRFKRREPILLGMLKNDIMENKLKIKFCKHIPFKGFYAIMLFGFLIIRKEYKDRQIRQSIINHENIHFQQALDFVGGIEQLKWIGFILFYI